MSSTFTDDIDDLEHPLSPLSPLTPYTFSSTSVDTESSDKPVSNSNATQSDSTNMALSTQPQTFPIVPHPNFTLPNVQWVNTANLVPTTYPSTQFLPNGGNVPLLQFQPPPYVNPDPVLPYTPSAPSSSHSPSESSKRSRKRKSSELSNSLLKIPQYKKLMEEDPAPDELDVVESLLNDPVGLSQDQISELKKRRRLLKNRNSASQSRARRRSEFDVMRKELTETRAQLESLKQQNIILSQENRHLHQTVGYFQQWIQAFTAANPSVNTSQPNQSADKKLLHSDGSESHNTSIIPFNPMNIFSSSTSFPHSYPNSKPPIHSNSSDSDDDSS
ncbi:hypothetical protein GEMRC1_002587 [Eukaryota sp. GEM-RC1]